ncbi:MAG: hypothetical protein Ta2A_14830 [Treponemataceae bacterium]|nr:MAG: hypothetical protein Ta2A_14830 [Treponemataceae bacterium]
MAIIKSTIQVGQKPPKEVLQRIKEAAKYPINLDDCPEPDENALAEFAFPQRLRRKSTEPSTHYG